MAKPTYIIKCDGTTLPNPHGYELELNDLDSNDTGRTETGRMIRERILSDVVKIKLTYKGISFTEATSIISATSKPEFTVNYWYGIEKTCTMYAGGTKTLSIHRVENTNTALVDLSFSLIDVGARA